MRAGMVLRGSFVTAGAAVAFASASLLAGTAAADEVCPKRGGVLDTIDMHYSAMDPATAAHPEYFAGLVFDSLIDVTPDVTFEPGLARELPEQIGELSYVFHLRDGVKFHDGTDFDAEAVKFNIERLVSGDVASPYTGTWQRFLDKVTVIDPLTVQIDLKEPWPGFYWGVASTLRIASPTGVQELGERFGIDAAPGTGPFIFKSIEPRKRIELVRNPDYYREGEPCIDGFTSTTISSGSMRLLMLQKGDLDVVNTFPESLFKLIENAPNVTVEEGEASTFTLLPVNTRVERLQDPRVRQAIQYAIDGQQLIESVYHGRGVMIDSIFPPWHPAYVPVADPAPIRRDLDKAKALLAEAGYGPDNPLTVELQTAQGGAHVERGTLLQAQLKEAGIELEVRSINEGTLLSNLATGNFELVLWQMLGGPTFKDYSWDLYSGDSSVNPSGYNQEGGFQNPKAAELSEAIAAASELDEVRDEIEQLQAIVFEDVPYIYVNFRNHRLAYNDNVHNLRTAKLKGREDIRRVWLDQ